MRSRCWVVQLSEAGGEVGTEEVNGVKMEKKARWTPPGYCVRVKASGSLAGGKS